MRRCKGLTNFEPISGGYTVGGSPSWIKERKPVQNANRSIVIEKGKSDFFLKRGKAIRVQCNEFLDKFTYQTYLSLGGIFAFKGYAFGFRREAVYYGLSKIKEPEIFVIVEEETNGILMMRNEKMTISIGCMVLDEIAENKRQCPYFDEKYCSVKCTGDWIRCRRCGEYLDVPHDWEDWDNFNGYVLYEVMTNCDLMHDLDGDSFVFCRKCGEEILKRKAGENLELMKFIWERCRDASEGCMETLVRIQEKCVELFPDIVKEARKELEEGD